MVFKGYGFFLGFFGWSFLRVSGQILGGDRKRERGFDFELMYKEVFEVFLIKSFKIGQEFLSFRWRLLGEDSYQFAGQQLGEWIEFSIVFQR